MLLHVVFDVFRCFAYTFFRGCITGLKLDYTFAEMGPWFVTKYHLITSKKERDELIAREFAAAFPCKGCLQRTAVEKKAKEEEKVKNVPKLRL